MPELDDLLHCNFNHIGVRTFILYCAPIRIEPLILLTLRRVPVVPAWPGEDATSRLAVRVVQSARMRLGRSSCQLAGAELVPMHDDLRQRTCSTAIRAFRGKNRTLNRAPPNLDLPASIEPMAVG